MRARWAKIISGWVVILAVAFLLLRPRPERFEVMFLHETNNFPVWYMVEVANMTSSPHFFSAWTEYDNSGNGAWQQMTSHKHTETLDPWQTNIFPLIKPGWQTNISPLMPGWGRRRIVVVYGRVRTNHLDQWIDSGKRFIGIRSKPKHTYIEMP